MTKMMTQDRVSLELCRQVGCHLGHSFLYSICKSPPLALWSPDSWLLRSEGSSRSQGLETGLGSSEGSRGVDGQALVLKTLGAAKAELNPAR